MGIFSVECRIESHRDRTRSVRVPEITVDTGSELTWIARRHLEAVGVEPEGKEVRFALANGQVIARPIGFAIIRVGDAVTTDEVAFAEESDFQLLGARTLEGLNLKVDPRNKRLIWAGPIPAAGTTLAA